MKGLILNNFYSMQENIKLSFIIAGFIFVVEFFFGAQILTMSIAAVIIIFPLNIGTSLQTDETSKWSKYELVTPVRRKTIIQSKYCSYLLLILIGMFCSFFLISASWIMGHPMNQKMFLFSYSYGVSLAMFTGAFLYPLLIVLGAAKSELIIISSCGISLVLILGVWFTVREILQDASVSSPEVTLSAVGLSILFFLISYFVSVRLHQKKEF